jgi:lysophospholipase L1-like esterase
MFRDMHGVLALMMAVALCSAFAVRTVWIKGKIAALSSPSPPIYAQVNTRLAAKTTRARVVLIGDSGVSRWPMTQLGERWEFINRGIGGETVTQLALRFESDAIALCPDVIVILAGMNDLVAASFMEESAARAVVRNTGESLRRLAHRATSSGSYLLLATIIPPARPDVWRLPVWSESLRVDVAEVNESLRRSPLPDGAALIDFSFALASGDQKLPDEYRLDTLHLNELGYERLTEALQSALEQIKFPTARPAGQRKMNESETLPPQNKPSLSACR